MLEGLEVVELNSSEFKKDNFEFRLDSEYFLKANLKYLSQLEKVGFKTIGEFSYVTDGIHTSIDYSETSNINLISATSPRENYFDISRKAFITEVAHKNNPRTALKENDIIISTVGTIGNCAVVTKSLLPANSDRHVGIIRCGSSFLPNYVSTFLLTKFGRFQTWRESTGNVQLNLFLYRIRTLKIANLTINFQKIIDDQIKLAHSYIENSRDKYLQAENLLLFELGLASLDKSTLDRLEKEIRLKKPDELIEELQDSTNQLRALFDAAIDETINMLDENPNLIAELREEGRDDLAEKIEKGIRTKIALTEYQIEQIKTDRYYYSKHYQNQINLIELYEAEQQNTNIKSFSESFGTTGRLDAEYYQKKYEKYIQLIKSLPNGFGLLSNVCTLKDTNLIPEDSKDYKYIELADVGKSGEITSCTNAKGVELPSRARRLVKTGDVIISSIEGSLNSCALITEDFNDALCSTGFFIIKSDLINSETLLVLFKTELMQNILKQNCSGTILTAINKTEVQNIPIPFIDKDIQKQIKEGISESFRLRSQSEYLLTVAKRAVELAIEEGEEMGLKYIAENV